MFKVGNGDAMPADGASITNVEHIKNGKIKHLSVTTANNGTYLIIVTYPDIIHRGYALVTVKGKQFIYMVNIPIHH